MGNFGIRLKASRLLTAIVSTFFHNNPLAQIEILNVISLQVYQLPNTAVKYWLAIPVLFCWAARDTSPLCRVDLGPLLHTHTGKAHTATAPL